MTRAEEIFDVLREVRYPGLSQDIVGLGYVNEVSRTGDDRWRIVLEIKTSEAEAVAAMERDARHALDEAGVAYELEVRRPEPQQPPTGAEPAPPEGPRAQAGTAQVEFQDFLPAVRYKIAVASGKGGVGKSTVAVNLALGLARLGAKVGLLDADIYGPSIPTMLGVSDQRPEMAGEKLAPIEVHGMKVVSLGFLTEGITPVIWRGPMAGRAIEQLMSDVDWSGVDFMILDLPPGTGDIQISLAQKGNLTSAVIVTTPQDVAMIDAIKGVGMFKKVGVAVMGIVENMSYFECPHCHERSEIYPRGVLGKEMERIGAATLGRIPIDPRVADGGDSGQPIVIAAPESAAAQAFTQLAATIKGTMETKETMETKG